MKFLLVLAALGVAPLPSTTTTDQPPPVDGGLAPLCRQAYAHIQGKHPPAPDDYRAMKDDASKCLDAGGGANALALRADAESGLGDDDAAMHDLDDAVKLAPYSLPVHEMRAMIVWGKKDYDAAFNEYSAVIEIEPRNFYARSHRGWLNLRGGKNDDALADINVALDVKPGDPVALIVRGEIEVARKDYAKAETDLSASLSVGANDDATYWRAVARAALGNHQGAEDDYDVLLTHDPKNWSALQGRAIERTQLKNYQGAIDDMTAALALKPTAPSYNNRGRIYAFLGDLDKAIADYDSALALDPNDAAALANRAIDHVKQRKYAVALADADHALALKPDNPKLLLARGFARRMTHDLPGAIADDTAAIAADPDNPQGYMDRGFAYRDAGRLEDAIADWTKASALDPKQSAGLVQRSQLYAARGDYAKALADLDEAIGRTPDSGEIWMARAEVKHTTGDDVGAKADYGKSIEAFTAYLAAHPNDADAYMRRGRAHLDRGETPDGIADETRAASLDPANSGIRLDLAIAHKNAGQYDAALADIDAGLKIDPTQGVLVIERAIVHTYRHDYDAAMQAYAAADPLMPGSDLPQIDRCWTRAKLNRDLDKAEAECRALVAKRPGWVSPRFDLAVVQFRENHLADAQATLDAILKDHPKDAQSLYMRGLVKKQLGGDGAADIAAAKAADPSIASQFTPFDKTP
jgi:tetratricopeptide (TPR) repeat protein